MKNPLLILTMAAVVFLATSCIDNDESEGVKQIRLGQAALLQAQANAETTLANSQAAIAAAEVAYRQAQADMQLAQIKATEEQTRHQEAMNTLGEELEAAQNEAQKASIQQQIERAEADHEAQMAMTEAQKINAEMNLLQMQNAYDQAQKDYEEATAQAEIDHQKNMDEIAANAENQKINDLLDDYELAYDMWSNQNLTINGTKGQIINLEYQLNSTKIADSMTIKQAKQNLEFAEENVVNLESDLEEAKAAVRNTDAIDEIIEGYETELETLEATQQSQMIQLGISENLAAKAWNSYYEKSDEFNNKRADFNTIDAELNHAENDTLAAYESYYEDLNWHHDSAGYDLGYVTYEKAVMTETGDATAGVYPTLNDKADVERAKAAAAQAKAMYDEATDNYDELYGEWFSAQQAMISAEKEMSDASVNAQEAENTSDLASSQAYATMTRISTIESYINQLTGYTDTWGTQWVESLEGLIESVNEEIENIWQPNYEDAIAAYEANQPLREVNYERYTLQISNLQERLLAEETKLEIYKAELDDWTAKLQAALTDEN